MNDSTNNKNPDQAFFLRKKRDKNKLYDSLISNISTTTRKTNTRDHLKQTRINKQLTKRSAAQNKKYSFSKTDQDDIDTQNLSVLEQDSSLNINNRSKILNNSNSNFIQNSLLNKTPNVSGVFLYRPYYSLPDLTSFVSDLIEIRISREFINTYNQAYRENKIFGSDIYTSDSDPVLILQHTGYYNINESLPEDIEGVSLFLRVGKGRVSYTSHLRFGITSKKSIAFNGHSIKPEGFLMLESLGTDEELEIMAERMPFLPDEYESNKSLVSKEKSRSYAFINLNTTPVLAFNLCDEAVYKFDIAEIADKSHADYTTFLSFKLKTSVLYLENSSSRIEISRMIDKETINNIEKKENNDICTNNNVKETKNNNNKNNNNNHKYCGKEIDDFLFYEDYEKYKLSIVLDPKNKNNSFINNKNIEIPLSNEKGYINVLYENLDWSEFVWSEKGLTVRDFRINNLKNFLFVDIKSVVNSS